jgi:hypothetical protein
MMLTSDQKQTALVAPCIPLGFLVRPENRTVPREQMVGFSDPAIFHRLMDLLWTLREPEVVALLHPEEMGYLAEFHAVFESLLWRPLPSHPHISEVANEELARLLPSATRLLESLERRTSPSGLQRWWRPILAWLRLG